MSKDTRKAILNAKHTIELESLDQADAITATYKETVDKAKKTRSDSMNALKIDERNRLQSAILKINESVPTDAETEAEIKTVHDEAIDAINGRDDEDKIGRNPNTFGTGGSEKTGTTGKNPAGSKTGQNEAVKTGKPGNKSEA